jgi:F0F1-type ATP synthase membrane subunit c/vacuolar-type H+-ATPase subunit K
LKIRIASALSGGRAGCAGGTEAQATTRKNEIKPKMRTKGFDQAREDMGKL